MRERGIWIRGEGEGKHERDERGGGGKRTRRGKYGESTRDKEWESERGIREESAGGRGGRIMGSECDDQGRGRRGEGG